MATPAPAHTEVSASGHNARRLAIAPELPCEALPATLETAVSRIAAIFDALTRQCAPPWNNSRNSPAEIEARIIAGRDLFEAILALLNRFNAFPACGVRALGKRPITSASAHPAAVAGVRRRDRVRGDGDEGEAGAHEGLHRGCTTTRPREESMSARSAAAEGQSYAALPTRNPTRGKCTTTSPTAGSRRRTATSCVSDSTNSPATGSKP